MSQYEKFQYYLTKFSDTNCPSFDVKDNENEIIYKTSFSGGWGDGGPYRQIKYNKNTKIFSTLDYRYYGYSYLPEPFDETEKYEIKKLDSVDDADPIFQRYESEYYVYILALSTGSNINLCMLSDYLFCLEHNLKCKYEDKMQEICDNIKSYKKYKYIFNLIPTKYKSKKIYENILRSYECDEEIIKSMPKEYYDEEISEFIIRVKTMLNCGKYVIGKDKYDKYMQYIPIEYHEFINDKYKRYVYSTEEKGSKIVREHYKLFNKTPSWEEIIKKLQSKNIDTNNIKKKIAKGIYCVLSLPYDDSESDVQVLLNNYILNLSESKINSDSDE